MLDSLVVTNVTVYVVEEFPGLPSCEDVTGNVTITSFLGEDVDSSSLLAMCRTGCVLPIFGDVLTNKDTGVEFVTKSRVQVEIQVGYPVLLDPFTKGLFARLPAFGHLDATLVWLSF